MAVSCDLEVDVNGEETFFLTERILASYSGRLRKLFGKSTGANRKLKVLFHDFPGGGESFELVSRFCYNSGKIDITPGNIYLLHSAAVFMEMNNSVSGSDNLLEQTEKSLEDISYWSLSDLLIALKKYENSLPLVNSSCLLDKCLDSLVNRLTLSSEASPCPSTSSPDSSGLRFSCDTRSTESLKTNFSKSTWWFDDLSFMSPNLIEMVIKSLISRKFDSGIISRFLFYYQKSKFHAAKKSDEKCKILEVVIETLYGLDKSSVPCKSLFGILRVAQSLHISKCSRNNLESMIGSQLDQAMLDNLLIPPPNGISYLYDVNLVLRFLNAFLRRGKSQTSPIQTRKVSSLLDLYIAEVAPDPCLKPSKFIALLSALPDSFRDCYDPVYRIIDMYLEVHAGLSEEEKMKICCALNYEKLSPETCIHLSQNTKFPSKSSIHALVSQQIKLRNLLEYGNSPSFSPTKSKGKKEASSDQQIVLYAGKLMISDDKEDIKAHLQGMQCRVMELEKVCRKMQTQITKIMKAKPSSYSNARALPRLCS
ncbi:hypothetical protein ACFE04_016426 [Oxalis oulophora]